jgi:K+-sensing histidine kinase KdpD
MQRLKRLAEDILDVSKIESRSLVIHKELLNLNEAISWAVQDSVKNQFDSRGGQISYEPIEDTILVEADSENRDIFYQLSKISHI